MLLKIITLFLPWTFKRQALQRWFGFTIHPNARIGMSWIFPKELIMEADSRIDHFTVAINLDCIKMELGATIGRGNWITGYPTETTSLHFKHQVNRRAELLLGESSAILKNHHFDCTNSIHIGRFSIVAGYHSQFLTHSIDVEEGRQDSSPIYIGDYTFVGTNVVVLGGSRLPSYSVLGAKSLLNKIYTKEWMFYGGVPTREIRVIPKTAKYFSRTTGYVI